MTRSSPDLVIRPARVADAEGIARAHVASWRAAYRVVIADATLDNLSVAERAAMWGARLETLAGDPPRGEALFVAVDARDEVRGFARACWTLPPASGKPSAPYDGELYAIYMAPGYEGRGVGRRLVGAVARWLAADGLRSLLVWALVDNPYRGFYAALGGELVLEREITIEGQALTEVGYGWPDIQALIARTTSADGQAG